MTLFSLDPDFLQPRCFFIISTAILGAAASIAAATSIATTASLDYLFPKEDSCTEAADTVSTIGATAEGTTATESAAVVGPSAIAAAESFPRIIVAGATCIIRAATDQVAGARLAVIVLVAITSHPTATDVASRSVYCCLLGWALSCV